MRENDFPNAKQWDKIVKDAFESDEIHVFSDNYNMKKQKLQGSINMKKDKSEDVVIYANASKGTNRKRFTALIAAAAAVAMMVPGSVYAYNRITSSISQTAKYQNTVKIYNPTSEVSSKAEDSSSESVQIMDREFGWVPEGYTESEKGYSNESLNGAITAVFYRLPDDEKFDIIDINMPFSESFENYESGNKTAMINYRVSYGNGEECNFGREIWITFNDAKYLLQLYITDDISRDDLLKMIDNIKLVPSDEIRFGIYNPKDFEPDTDDTYVSPEREVNMEKMNINNVGDTVSFTDEYFDPFDVTLNSMEITDSFDGINTDQCGWEADYSEIIDENGNIAENIRSYIKLGDGVDTIDEVIREESVPMHILKMNLTFTNTADITNDICICPELFVFKDGVPVVDWNWLSDDTVYHDSIRYRRADFGSHFSLDADPDKKGGKNHVILEPGESADVELAFFVTDDELGDIYLNFFVVGNTLSGSLEKGIPVYDLRQ